MSMRSEMMMPDSNQRGLVELVVVSKLVYNLSASLFESRSAAINFHHVLPGKVQGTMGATSSKSVEDDFEESPHSGFNSYTYSTGEHYEGGWENNKREGKGTYFYSNGDVYSGIWQKNLKSGYGVYIKSNHVETYGGEWRNNSRNGRGCLIQRNGTRYVGAFKQDLRHGPGVSIRRNGQILGEIWRHGQVISRKHLFLCGDSDLVVSRRFKFGSSNEEEESIFGTTVGILEDESDRGDDTQAARRKTSISYPIRDESSAVDLEQPADVIPDQAVTRSDASKSSEWTVDDVTILLKFAGLGSLCQTFSEQQVDGFALTTLVSREVLMDDSTLAQLGLNKQSAEFKLLMSLVRVIVKMRHKVEVASVISYDSVANCFKELEVNYEDIDFDYECGRGGYGKVYKATWMHRAVACKVFRAKEGSDELQVSKDFWLELNALAKLRHPNITLLLGVCLKPRYCILTEFVSCGALFDLIHRHRELPNWGIARILGVAYEICLGMSYLHSQGVLHCDLKSSNVLITDSWTVKIADFGLSFLFPEDEPFDTAKVPLGCVGTHHWIAPEVLRGEEFSQAADVYSFGVILWEMIHRKIPFQDLTAAQVIGIVGYGGKRLQVSANCPGQVKLIIQRCLLRDRMDLRPSFSRLTMELGGLHRLAVLEVEESLDSFFGKRGGDSRLDFSLTHTRTGDLYPS
jgi:tRNA A-37 threonylcarbamoyl transferase component Bud32